jgi:predicted transcriptional regulator
MPASFEQQRELIATFRSVARSLLASPEEPVLMKDLDGNLMRSRVRTVINRLIALGFVEETKARDEGSHYAHLEWRLVDEPARDFLSRIVDDQVKTSKLLWPTSEDEEEAQVEEPEDLTLEEAELERTEAPASQDPVALVAGVLEGFNDRIAAMEKRAEAMDNRTASMATHMGKLAGGMSELIAAVAKVAAKESPKPYDDTELLLTVHELKDQVAQVQAKVDAPMAVTTDGELAEVLKLLAKATGELKVDLEQLQKDGIEAKNEAVDRALQVMGKAFLKMNKQFEEWMPAMEECIGGLKVVNKNVLSTNEEVTAMQSAIIQSLNAISKGVSGGVIKMRPAPEAPPPPGDHMGIKRRRGLPSLSKMVEDKDRKKLDGNGLDLILPGALAAQIKKELVKEDYAVDIAKTQEREEKGT